MKPKPPLASLALLAATSLLSGCVAALIPLAAGAAMGGSQIRGGASAQAARQSTFEPTRPGIAASLPEDVQGVELVLTDYTALPAPSGGLGSAGAAGGASFARFADYALEQARRDPSLMPRAGALLASPGRLSPKRIECGGKPPAVVIDLDPEGDTFDPYSAGPPDPRLPAVLANLRENNVAIFWSSHLATPFTGQLRALLAETGLDPEGRDRLLTMHSLDERKQTRRAAVALTHCPVAILGDERGDFDELYLYLKEPEAPMPPDSLIGAGWFLADPFPEVTPDAP